jgi:hypothetical protein
MNEKPVLDPKLRRVIEGMPERRRGEISSRDLWELDLLERERQFEKPVIVRENRQPKPLGWIGLALCFASAMLVVLGVIKILESL